MDQQTRPAFTPVPLRRRRDGWTPEIQIAFIAALAECRCVLEACRRVGRSSESAYRLSRRPDAASFRRAWDMALAPVPRPLVSRSHKAPPSPSAGPSPSVSSTSADEWHVSELQASSTSARRPPSTSAAATPRAMPAYSLEAFRRLPLRTRPR